MFSASNFCTVMVLCHLGVMMMMMMMMRQTDAAPRAPSPSEINIKSMDTDLKTVSLILDSTKMLPNHHIRPIKDHSISPWTYNTTHYQDLFPSNIHQAQCSLSGCLDKRGLEDLTFQSKPIMHQILVLRRQDGGAKGNYRYRLETMVISVGCTCVKHSIQIQQ